jgi:hypothetical protein
MGEEGRGKERGGGERGREEEGRGGERRLEERRGGEGEGGGTLLAKYGPGKMCYSFASSKLYCCTGKQGNRSVGQTRLQSMNRSGGFKVYFYFFSNHHSLLFAAKKMAKSRRWCESGVCGGLGALFLLVL